MKEAAAHEQHHKVKRRALQLMALPLLAKDGWSSAPPTVDADGSADLKTGVPGVTNDANSRAQQSTALEEVQALQAQLLNAQHPEVCTQTPPGIQSSWACMLCLAAENTCFTLTRCSAA